MFSTDQICAAAFVTVIIRERISWVRDDRTFSYSETSHSIFHCSRPCFYLLENPKATLAAPKIPSRSPSLIETIAGINISDCYICASHRTAVFLSSWLPYRELWRDTSQRSRFTTHTFKFQLSVIKYYSQGSGTTQNNMKVLFFFPYFLLL